jgi:tetratricopeptide (TPR) repeat protein
LPRPGLLAPQTEKRFYEGVQAYLKGDAAKALTAFEQASAKDDKNISDDLFAGLSAIMLGANEKARGYLEHVVSSDIELPDKLLQKYLPPDRAAIRLSVDITPRVEAQVPFSSLGAALSLAELYQAEGRLEDAIGLLQQLAEAAPNNSELKLSLCDLLYEDGDDESVVEVSNGADNDSIVGLAILHLRAKALARRGLNDAAGETFTACLKKTAGRDPEFLKEIRYDRAAFYAETNQAAKARKEFEKLYAEDSQYLDVAHRVSG